ncbi:MAG: redox-regulated ATPase YchF [Candidatus Omnitrophota bacterium]|jgi:GTP-binding protein YchF|nr:MAG: redox-regulated ATPase YchF [Candidatus Omnitrophota bacterium]
MQIGIIGLTTSGKTTVFNALTHGHADTSLAGSRKDPNRGVSHVPDERIDFLTDLCKPKKTTYASVEFTDVAGLSKGEGKEKGFSNEFLGHLRNMEALLLVIRVFKNESVPHPEGRIDPARDLETILAELILADMAIIENRLRRIDESWNKLADKRKELAAEKESMTRFHQTLENNRPIITAAPTSEEIDKYIRPYGLLSGKQILVLANIADQTDSKEVERLVQLQTACAQWNLTKIIMNAQLECDLLDFPEEEWSDYYQSVGLEGSAATELIRESYRILRQQSFLTYGPDEVRAWTIPIGCSARQAAGKIHSDIERGFIRAEVMSFDDLKNLKTVDEVKKAGRFRLEGKEYVVQDGDIITFRFSV